MSLARHVPNALTLGNLACGCCGILLLQPSLNLFPEVEAGNIFLFQPGYFVLTACVFDFLDGFFARSLNVTSPIGKQLDSLADMVSFGVLPALTMAWMINEQTPYDGLVYISFLLAIGAALRLARFNVDDSQKDSFRGLPTPAHALFVSGLSFAADQGHHWILQPYVLAATTVVFAWLMVSPLRLFALKFNHYRWKGNETRFTFLALSVLLIAGLQWSALSPIILLYLALSLGFTPKS